MNRALHKLSTRVTLVFVLLLLLLGSGLGYYWSEILLPLFQHNEQTKADLLITPYTSVLERAVDENDTAQIESIINELILLSDPNTGAPMISRFQIETIDGRNFSVSNSNAGSTLFRVEVPLFSPSLQVLNGTATLDYNDEFYHKIRRETANRMMVAFAVLLVILLLLRRFLAYLMAPLLKLAGAVGRIDFSHLVDLPPQPSHASSEIRQVWHAVDQLLRRLRQREEDLIGEHQAAQEALRAKLEAESASQAKSQFLANMSHELRTPLNAIIGYSEILMEDAADGGYTDAISDLEKIHSSGKHLLSLINDILDLSKIEAGKMQLYTEEFDVAQLARDVATTVQPMIEKNGNTLTLAIQSDVGIMHSDATKIRQILMNLLSNAAKFTSQQEITFTVGKEVDENSDWIKFTVADRGIGMSDDQVEKLFQSFTQADASTTRRYGGTGLGLAISRHFAHMLGGEIKVESALGEGSVFTVTCPVEIAARPQVERRPVLRVDRRERTSNVLVIDDDPSVHDWMAKFLTRQGFKTMHAFSGREGLEKATALLPDVITLDVMMPGMDGWAVLAELNKDPALRDIPVIMISMVDDVRDSQTLGAADFMTKPVDRAKLNTLLSHYTNTDKELFLILFSQDIELEERLRPLLEEESCRMEVVANTSVLAQKLTASEATMVFIDFGAGDMAFEALETIRKHDEREQMQIVGITGLDGKHSQDELSGVVDHILHRGNCDAEELSTRLLDSIVTSVRRRNA